MRQGFEEGRVVAQRSGEVAQKEERMTEHFQPCR